MRFKEQSKIIHMDLIQHFKSTYGAIKEDALIVFNGEITQEIVHSYTAMVGQTMTLLGAGDKPKKKVYHILVELLQNICKHSGHKLVQVEAGQEDGEDDDSQVGLGTAIFGYDKSSFVVCTANKINNDDIENLKEMLKHINSLDKMGLKELYKFMLKKSRLSERGGAGLGYIDIAKKNLEPFVFDFLPIDDNKSIFVLSYSVPAPKEEAE